MDFDLIGNLLFVNIHTYYTNIIVLQNDTICTPLMHSSTAPLQH